MSTISLFSIIGWYATLSCLFYQVSDFNIKILLILLLINSLNLILHFFIKDFGKYWAYKIYCDNLMAFTLSIFFPICFSHGYIIQIFLGIFFNYFFLKSKSYISISLIILMISETIFFFLYNDFKLIPYSLCNITSTLLFSIFFIIIKKRILLYPEKRLKNIIDNINVIFRRQLTECISPLNYYTKNLKSENKKRVEKIIFRLLNLSKNNSLNIGQVITLIKASLGIVHTSIYNLTFIQKENKKDIELDSYLLMLILYTILDNLLQNQATEITIEHNKRGLFIIDNALGFKFNSKKYKESKLKLAIDLLELYNISVNYSSNKSGNSIEIIF